MSTTLSGKRGTRCKEMHAQQASSRINNGLRNALCLQATVYSVNKERNTKHCHEELCQLKGIYSDIKDTFRKI